MESLGSQGFASLFTTFRRSALRLESRDEYLVPEEAAALRAHRAGRDHPTGWLEPWLEVVRRSRAAGRVMRRVRVIADPPTGYQRFGLDVAPITLAAGEDIRLLRRAVARRLPLAGRDFWVFDEERVVLMGFDAAGRFLGAELLSGGSVVRPYLRAWGRAWTRAVPYPEFVAPRRARDWSRPG